MDGSIILALTFFILYLWLGASALGFILICGILGATVLVTLLGPSWGAIGGLFGLFGGGFLYWWVNRGSKTAAKKE